MASTTDDGGGDWLVATDGGNFDLQFAGCQTGALAWLR
jgi:hypothetical protein